MSHFSILYIFILARLLTPIGNIAKLILPSFGWKILQLEARSEMALPRSQLVPRIVVQRVKNIHANPPLYMYM